MSALAIAPRMRPLTLGRQTRSVSSFGQKVDAWLSETGRNIGQAAQDWSDNIASALVEIFSECSTEDWDGEGAKAVSVDTLAVATSVADLLFQYVPKSTPSPDVIPQHDGEIVLTWTRSPDLVFSVSVGSHKKLNYAGRFGAGVEPHGVERFDPSDPASISHLASMVTRLFKEGIPSAG